ARRDPDLAARLDADLCRSQHVPGRMQADPRGAQPELLAIVVHVVALLAQAPAQDRQPGGGDVVLTHPDAGMVAVPVGDHRTFDRAPGVDVEGPMRAIKALAALDYQIFGRLHACNIGVPMSLGRKAQPRPELMQLKTFACTWAQDCRSR